MPRRVPFALSSIRYEVAAPVDNSAQREGVFQAIHCLPARLSHVVILRHYGEDGNPLKLAEIGEHLGISDERVRQLLTLAYSRLRNTCAEFSNLNKD